jgi:hypothetical protein
MTYTAQGKVVMLGDDPRAVCEDAQRAADMLNRARYLNDEKRKYTAAARLIAKVECLDGFRWIEEAQS